MADKKTKIANFLVALDCKVGWVAGQIAATQTFKRGQQQMFV